MEASPLVANWQSNSCRGGGDGSLSFARRRNLITFINGLFFNLTPSIIFLVNLISARAEEMNPATLASFSESGWSSAAAGNATTGTCYRNLYVYSVLE